MHLALHAQRHFRYVLNHPLMANASIISHGLRFFVPTRTDGGYANLLDTFEVLLMQADPDLPNPPLWPGFPPEQLRTNNRDAVVAGRVPWRAAVEVPKGFYLAGMTADCRIVLLQEMPILLGFGGSDDPANPAGPSPFASIEGPRHAE
jgi:hypothetical protein